MTTNNAIENPCTCDATTLTLCASCVARARNLDVMLEDLGNLRSDVEAIDVDDFMTESAVERYVSNALDEFEREQNVLTEDDVDEKVDRACADLKDEIEDEMARDSDVERLREEVDDLRDALEALQARTFEARWKRFVASARTFLHVEQFKHVLRLR